MMTDLIERYVHEVVRTLPKKDQKEVGIELTSLIQDQIDDRFGDSPTEAEVEKVLIDLGDPREMAASYGSKQYLIGPEFYTQMMMVLRIGWLGVPPITVFLSVAWAMLTSRESTLWSLFVDTLISTAFVTFIFSALVVLIFAVMEYQGFDGIDRKKVHNGENDFNPKDLPKLNDPAAVDYAESASGIALGIFFILVFIYFLQVGGLTLRFYMADPGQVIPIPVFWTIILILNACAILLIHLLVIRRRSWNAQLYLAETALMLLGTLAMYFVILAPLGEFLIKTYPSLVNWPLSAYWPEIIAVLSGLGHLFGGLGNQVKFLKNFNELC